jgi:type VI secretion system protein ImpG
MSFNKYYEDELSYLRGLGKEFTHANPDLAPFLAERGNDPDVERLLEGFAFLTGRVRQKIDDDLPELTHSLISLLWPHYLRPVPSMSILEFSPVVNAISERKMIERGIEVDSVPVEGTACRFRTCYDVDLYPLDLEAAELKRDGRGCRLKLVFALHAGATLDKLDLQRLRLYLHGESHISRTTYLWLSRYLTRIKVSAAGDAAGSDMFELDADQLQPAGFSEQEALLPYPPNAFLGYRVIQEYFALPEKFLFFDVAGLERLAGFSKMTERFEISFEFSRALDDSVRLDKDNFRLYCSPVINLFAHDGDPVRIDNTRVEYRIRPSGKEPAHREIYSIDQVEGWIQGTGVRRSYKAFESFEHRQDSKDSQASIYYRTRLRPAVVGKGVDTYIAFVGADERHAVPPTETVSLQLTCSNRNLAEKLRAGDISTATGTSPEYATFKNISPVSPSMSPPLESGLHWRLISGMALNYVSLTSIEAFRNILAVYDFRALHDRQAERASQLRLDGLTEAHVEPVDLLHHGLPIRGLRTHLEMRESNFAGEGDMFLLASVLDEFLALYASVNSFHQLVVKGMEHGEIYQWPTRTGQQPLL